MPPLVKSIAGAHTDRRHCEERTCILHNIWVCLVKLSRAGCGNKPKVRGEMPMMRNIHIALGTTRAMELLVEDLELLMFPIIREQKFAELRHEDIDPSEV